MYIPSPTEPTEFGREDDNQGSRQGKTGGKKGRQEKERVPGRPLVKK